VSFAVVTKFGFRSAVQKQLSVAVSGSCASSVSLHVAWIGPESNSLSDSTLPVLTADLLIAVLLSVTVQPKSAVPPVFWATYCTEIGRASCRKECRARGLQPR